MLPGDGVNVKDELQMQDAAKVGDRAEADEHYVFSGVEGRAGAPGGNGHSSLDRGVKGNCTSHHPRRDW